MIEPFVANTGLDRWVDHVISVDGLGIYNPAAPVYQLAVDRLGTPAQEVGFVSANCWDACGAKAFGYHVFWINRTGAPLDALGVTPDHIIGSLAELLAPLSRPSLVLLTQVLAQGGLPDGTSPTSRRRRDPR